MRKFLPSKFFSITLCSISTPDGQLTLLPQLSHLHPLVVLLRQLRGQQLLPLVQLRLVEAMELQVWGWGLGQYKLLLLL